MSVFSSLRYCLGDPADTSNIYLALAFLPFGLFFDFMDGRVARWRKKSSMMGQELDSLADLVCFVHARFLSVWLLSGCCVSRGSPSLTIDQPTNTNFCRYPSV